MGPQTRYGQVLAIGFALVDSAAWALAGLFSLPLLI
jgi:hypothetical protein